MPARLFFTSYEFQCEKEMSFSSENETVVNSDLPVVLVHAACTGGSLIYRLMVSNFGLFGLTEIGHGRRTAFGFSPVDPEAQMFSLGQIDHDEFGKILSERLINADKIARHREQRLLVREHSHNYFFNPDNAEVVPAGPSWVADHLEPYFQSELPIVVTVRDPIDSWLGFRQNFNHLQPKRFEDYCEITSFLIESKPAVKRVRQSTYSNMKIVL